MAPSTLNPIKNPAVPPIDTKKSVSVKMTSRWNLISGYFFMMTKPPMLPRRDLVPLRT